MRSPLIWITRPRLAVIIGSVCLGIVASCNTPSMPVANPPTTTVIPGSRTPVPLPQSTPPLRIIVVPSTPVTPVIITADPNTTYSDDLAKVQRQVPFRIILPTSLPSTVAPRPLFGVPRESTDRESNPGQKHSIVAILYGGQNPLHIIESTSGSLSIGTKFRPMVIGGITVYFRSKAIGLSDGGPAYETDAQWTHSGLSFYITASGLQPEEVFPIIESMIKSS